MDNRQRVALKNFYCIDYPALVKNEKEAIRTLGGETRIQQTFQRKNTKFLLNFTPDNIFSKVLCSTQYEDPTSENETTPSSSAGTHASNSDKNDSNDESNETPSTSASKSDYSREASAQLNNKHGDLISMPCLLMSVKRQTSRAGSSPTLHYEIIGKIKTMYTFQKIADFQYLPMNSVSKTNTSTSSVDPASSNNSSTTFTFNAFYDNFLFNNIQNYDVELRKTSMHKLFILPPFFSRFDDPVSYSFKSETVKKVKSTVKSAVNDSPSKKSSPVKSPSKKSTPTKSATSEEEEGESDAENDEADSDIENDEASNSFNNSNNKSGTIHSENVSANENEASANTTKDEYSPELIRSMRQERSSQAILVTFKCKEVPMSEREFCCIGLFRFR